jgi:chloramphenicol O-acetyltransferase
MPVSIEVHHALVDGVHVGRFFERFQHHLDDVAATLLSPTGGEGGGG